MSETAEERSKRRFVGYLLSTQWAYQYTVFYNRRADSFNAIQDGANLRKRVARVHASQPFLYRLCLKSVRATCFFEESFDKRYVTAAYHTFFTDRPIKEDTLLSLAESTIGSSLKLYSRKIDADKIGSYVKAVESQNPHNLNAFFNKLKINRFSLLNGASRIVAN